MRRADRLFGIVQRLRGGRLATARTLAARFEVSERTIYRDIADLQASGVPVAGEAGVGYLLRDGFELPPLMFTRDEVVALVAGARMVQSFGGSAMAAAAAEALVKIGAVLPEAARDRLQRTEIHAARDALPEAIRVTLDRLDGMVAARQVVRLGYRDENDRDTLREVRPLGLWFWGKVWTLIAWCELRGDFRMFRLDRIRWLEDAGRTFKPAPAQRLVDFHRREECRGTAPAA